MIDGMLQVEEAQARVLAEVRPLDGDEVPFTDAFGRVLREDVIAAEDAPPADNSGMDGYAIRSEDVPGELRVLGDIPAGRVASEKVEPGTALRIMTGAFVPEGADAVAQVEITDGGIERVQVQRAVARGANIRRRGEDIRAGAVVIREGTPIGAAEVAMLAAVRKTSVRVGRRPTVAILATGDELLEPHEPAERGKIVNSNTHLLTALVRGAGAIAQPFEIVRDTHEATVAALERASECDFVITSGGVSVGAYDFVKGAMDALGAETKFWRVAMKPGKPFVLSRLRDRVCLGLPGNPVSGFVSFHLFVAPALKKAMGQTANLTLAPVATRLASPLRGGDRRTYSRVRVIAREGELVSQPMATQGSGSLTSIVQANGLAIVAEGTAVAEAGSLIPTLLIGPVGES
jgi:molybdopterin molybdotransferase